MRQLNEYQNSYFQKNQFGTNNIEESAPITLIGRESIDGEWVIMKINETSGVAFSYATQKNNTSITNYTGAWNDRTTLTYSNFSGAF